MTKTANTTTNIRVTKGSRSGKVTNHLLHIAQHNAEQREQFQHDLRMLRANVSLEELSNRSGWSIERIHAMESYWYEWTIHEALFYALCLGAKVDLSVKLYYPGTDEHYASVDIEKEFGGTNA